MGAQLLREVAARTSELAGDGTTTATVLAHSIIQEGLKYLAAGMNPMASRHGIERAIKQVVSELNVVEGLQFVLGYLSPYFVNNAERGSAVLEDVYILLCDRRLSSITELVPLLEAVAKSGRPLLVIAEDIDSDALATLVINSVRGAIKTCAVKAPNFGDRHKAMLQDMAALTGTKVISEELGRSLAKASLDDLGQAKRIEVGKDSTTLIGGRGSGSALQARMSLIRQERELAATEYERKQLDERLARLAGGVALIKVGAATETELKERNYDYNAATRSYGDLLAMGVSIRPG